MSVGQSIYGRSHRSFSCAYWVRAPGSVLEEILELSRVYGSRFNYVPHPQSSAALFVVSSGRVGAGRLLRAPPGCVTKSLPLAKLNFGVGDGQEILATLSTYSFTGYTY